MDFVAISKIIGIDILLSGDNAILIAMAVAALPASQQNKAIGFGTLGAIVARIWLLAIAAFLVNIPVLKLVGGLYLAYIGYSLINSGDESEDVDAKPSFWGAVWTIVVADIIMSLDNVLAVTGASNSAGEHALYYAIGGILFSIPLIIFASKLIVRLMEKYSSIVWFGGGLLGWVGAEMAITDSIVTKFLPNIHHYGTLISAVVGLGVMAVAYYKTR